MTTTAATAARITTCAYLAAACLVAAYLMTLTVHRGRSGRRVASVIVVAGWGAVSAAAITAVINIQ
ncbi:hypothetical protein [Stackebrandtia soli]|uniref:hypothetical protein n=1 Tax=Stackebrandtia soli TaxID=1892856 RepID=UPI0039EAAEB2